MATGSVDGPVGRALWERADQVLPGGGIYMTRSADFAGRGVVPGFIESADGCHVTDVDGRRYIDFVCANGPNLLGYLHPEVEAAARDQAHRCTSATLFPPSLVEVVEALLERRKGFAWGVVAKNGSDVVTLAARVARQATGARKLITFEQAYHGSDAELSPLAPAGVPPDRHDDVVRVAWNDADRLASLVGEIGSEIAAILVNPLDQNPLQPTQRAHPEFISAIRQVREQTGCRLIIDDVRHGFRLHPQGSEVEMGLAPDLICLGKALGNGYSISAVLGVEEVRPAAREIMFTATAMFETPPMAAAMATLEIYDRDNVFATINRAGERLRDGFHRAAKTTGHEIVYSGPATMPTFLFADDPRHRRLFAFAEKSAHLGAIFHPTVNWFISAAHTDAAIDEAIEIAHEAMASLEETTDDTH